MLPMPPPVDFAQELKQQADIVRFVGDYVKLRKTGAMNFTGLCPFHSEKSPSFSVHATRQFFHCFGCGASGDIFAFVQKIENVSFPEALRMVAQKLDIPVPRYNFSGSGDSADAVLRAKLLEIHERASVFFQEQLRGPEASRAREYLVGRGIDGESLARFRIGFAPDSGFALRDCFRGAFEEDALRQSGLFSWKDRESDPEGSKTPLTSMYSRFRNRVVFPICNEQGRVIAFTARTLETGDKAGPKYLNSSETPIYSKGRVLFNLDKAKEAIRKTDYAILVEGQMDCISVFTAGFQNVIASSGTAFTEAQVRLLGRFSKNIAINFDPDTAGAAAAERSIGMLVEEDFNIRIINLEPGFDPDLLIRRQGKDAYARTLRESQRYFEWLIQRALKIFPPRTPEAKVKAINYLLPHLQKIPSRIVRDEVASDAAQKFGIDSDVLRRDLKRAVAQRAASVALPATIGTGAEHTLLTALTSPDPAVRVRMAVRMKQDSLHHGLACATLLEKLAVNPEQDPMGKDFEPEERQRLATVLQKVSDQNEEGQGESEEHLEMAIEALRQRRLERRNRDLTVEIADAERRHDNARLAELLMEQQRVNQALINR